MGGVAAAVVMAAEAAFIVHSSYYSSKEPFEIIATVIIHTFYRGGN